MNGRLIRVHLPHHPTFLLETTLGEVSAVSLDDAKPLLGMDEKEAAAKLKAMGATFVDLDHDRTVVRVARGYRSRDTRPKVDEAKPWKKLRGKSLDEVDNPDHKPKKRRAKPDGATGPKTNYTLDSMSGEMQEALLEDPEIPF